MYFVILSDYYNNVIFVMYVIILIQFCGSIKIVLYDKYLYDFNLCFMDLWQEEESFELIVEFYVF